MNAVTKLRRTGFAQSSTKYQAIPESQEELVRALDIRSPRYTSYPTADQFAETFGPTDYANQLVSLANRPSEPLSLYVHIPFCESLCFYCGCNKRITRNHDKATPYVEHLIHEIDLVTARIGEKRILRQMHWGGGTPTFLRPDQMNKLMKAIRNRFVLQENSELSIEVDPRFAIDQTVKQLADHGFNRMSIGVQDFEPAVQEAINRVQPPDITRRVLNAARECGFESINFDLIYGLPRQTRRSFSKTISQVIAMRPDRIALYNYAHLPTRFPAQRLIHESELPAPSEKMAVFDETAQALESGGYCYIGMDHFALPDDELSVAMGDGSLHRNFQGYSTQSDLDLIGLGASAISHVGNCYSQNDRSVVAYGKAIDRGELPVVRGIELSGDDRIRRSVISALMCNGQLDTSAISETYQTDFSVYFHRELNSLKRFEELGLVHIDNDAISITNAGRRHALRAIGAVFDRHLQDRSDRGSLSRVL